MDNLFKDLTMEIGIMDYAEFIMPQLVNAIENENNEEIKSKLDTEYQRINSGLEWAKDAERNFNDLQEALNNARELLKTSNNKQEVIEDTVVNEQENSMVSENQEEISEEAVEDANLSQEDVFKDEEIINEVPVADAENSFAPAVELPIIDNQPIEEVVPIAEATDLSQAEAEVASAIENASAENSQSEISYIREADSQTADKGVSLTAEQSNNIRSTIDQQQALFESINNKEKTQVEEVVPVESVADTSVKPETSEKSELELMTEQLSEAMANKDETKVQELTEAISEKNKQLQKVA